MLLELGQLGVNANFHLKSLKALLLDMCGIDKPIDNGQPHVCFSFFGCRGKIHTQSAHR